MTTFQQRPAWRIKDPNLNYHWSFSDNPLHNDHVFQVPRVVVVHRFDCTQATKRQPEKTENLKLNSYRFVSNVSDGARQQSGLPPEHGDVAGALRVIEVGLAQVGLPDTTGTGISFPEMQVLIVPAASCKQNQNSFFILSNLFFKYALFGYLCCYFLDYNSKHRWHPFSIRHQGSNP